MKYNGKIHITSHLEPLQKLYLHLFLNHRKMIRDTNLLLKHIKNTDVINNIVHEKVGLPLGEQGDYYVGFERKSVLEPNVQPKNQPSIWCQWDISKNGNFLYCKECDYTPDLIAKWLKYLNNNIFNVWNKQLDGYISWNYQDYYHGSEPFEKEGIIEIKNNLTTIYNGEKEINYWKAKTNKNKILKYIENPLNNKLDIHKKRKM